MSASPDGGQYSGLSDQNSEIPCSGGENSKHVSLLVPTLITPPINPLPECSYPL